MAVGEKGEAGSSGRRIAAWAVTAASPLIVWLIVKAAAAGLSTGSAVALGGLPPENPAATLRAMSSLAQLPTQKVTDEMLRTVQEGLEVLPLSFEPFFVAARAAEQKGDLRRATILMEEARLRRLSHPGVRSQLVVYYTKTERYPEALSEIDFILRRNADMRPAMLPELAKLISDPRGRAALATILAREPAWREEFFTAAGTRKLAPADARDLFEKIRALKPKGDLRLERQLVLQTQASSGDYAGARRTWLAGLPAQERAGSGQMFDGAFRGVPASKPFGWQFHSAEAGRAEPAKDGGRTYLDVAYFGGRGVLLAEQTLALAPGAYTLRVVARSPNGIQSGKLFWRITCLPGGNPIAALDLSQANAGDRRFAAAFTVPASGCPGQALNLVGEPGDVAAAVNLEVSRMEIAR